MDYHIEISSIVQFVNDQIRQKSILNYNAPEIYKHIKKAVLDSEIKPFLYPLAEGENNSMYEKYEKMNAEWDGQYIPDFFEHVAALYDLDKKAEAKSYFEKAVALDSNFVLARQNLEAIKLEAAGKSAPVNPAANTPGAPPANKNN